MDEAELDRIRAADFTDEEVANALAKARWHLSDKYEGIVAEQTVRDILKAANGVGRRAVSDGWIAGYERARCLLDEGLIDATPFDPVAAAHALAWALYWIARQGIVPTEEDPDEWERWAQARKIVKDSALDR